MSPTLVSYTRVEKVTGPRCRKFRIWKEDDTLYATSNDNLYKNNKKYLDNDNDLVTCDKDDKEDHNHDKDNNL